MRLDVFAEVAQLGRLALLPRQLQRHAGFHRDGHGAMGAFLGIHPPEEEEVVAAPRLHRIEGEVERVRHVRGPREPRMRHALVHRDRDQACPRRDTCDLLVQGARLTEQRAVHGVQRRCLHRAGDHGRGRPGVVADHVELVRALEAGEHMMDLHLRPPDLGARSDFVDECELRGRARVTRREERDVVSCLDEAVGEERHHPLDPAVARRGHRKPDGREDCDPHVSPIVTSPSSSRISHAFPKARTPERRTGPVHAGRSSGATVSST